MVVAAGKRLSDRARHQLSAVHGLRRFHRTRASKDVHRPDRQRVVLARWKLRYALDGVGPRWFW